MQQARLLSPPQYIVGTVPDFEPTTASEIEAKDVYTEFLGKKDRPNWGIMLDMCYHPLLTQNLRLAKQHGWRVVDGVEVVRHQLKVQWEPWTGQRIDRQQEETAWTMLRESVLSDPTVTPVMGNL
jgi:quinate dehydrogenase